MVNPKWSRRGWLCVASAPFVQAANFRWTLTGRTLDSHGRPVPKAMVTVVDTLQSVRRTAQSGPRGIFQFKGLTPGTVYEVFARLGDAVSRTERVYQIGTQQVVLIDLRIPLASG